MKLKKPLKILRVDDMSVEDGKVIKFSDNQHLITLNTQKYSDLDEHVLIVSEMNGFENVEKIALVNAALRNLDYRNIHLYIPYVLGARSDRKFEDGSVSYLKDIIAPMINRMKFKSVYCLDPHSDVIEATFDNLHKIAIEDVFKMDIEQYIHYGDVLVSPDAGAMKKIFNISKKCVGAQVVCANKVRDISTGKILKTEIPDFTSHDSSILHIFDDICDGGRTFIELFKAIKEKNDKIPVHLWITHGIFSNPENFEQMKRDFKLIHTTNSIDHKVIHLYPVETTDIYSDKFIFENLCQIK